MNHLEGRNLNNYIIENPNAVSSSGGCNRAWIRIRSATGADAACWWHSASRLWGLRAACPPGRIGPSRTPGETPAGPAGGTHCATFPLRLRCGLDFDHAPFNHRVNFALAADCDAFAVQIGEGLTVGQRAHDAAALSVAGEWIRGQPGFQFRRVPRASQVRQGAVDGFARRAENEQRGERGAQHAVGDA